MQSSKDNKKILNSLYHIHMEDNSDVNINEMTNEEAISTMSTVIYKINGQYTIELAPRSVLEDVCIIKECIENLSSADTLSIDLIEDIISLSPSERHSLFESAHAVFHTFYKGERRQELCSLAKILITERSIEFFVDNRNSIYIIIKTCVEATQCEDACFHPDVVSTFEPYKKYFKN